MKPWIIAVMLCLASAFAAAKEAPAVARELGADRVVTGDRVVLMQAVPGDLAAAGGTIDVLAEVGGDALLAGGTLRIDAPVQEGLYAAGGRVSIGAAVARNARVAGGDVLITPTGRVAGNVSLAGGDVRVLGPVGGYLVAGGGRVLIDAPIGGDVEVRAGHVELGPRAAIGGRLRYSSREEIVRDPAARVEGGVERAPWVLPATRHFGATAFGWVWTVGLMALAACLAAALPRSGERVQRALTGRTGDSVLAGFVALVCIPPLAIILIITLVGAPIGLLALLAYPALLLVGYAFFGVAAGRFALARWLPARQAERALQVLAAALCMLAIGLVARVPGVGSVIGFVVLLFGVGAVLVSARQREAVVP